MRLLRQSLLFVSLLLSALALVACDGGGVTPSLTSIAVTTASSSLYIAGPATQVTVTGYYSDGRTSDLTGASTFVSSDTSVVSVDASGKVSPVGQGTAVITATNAGSGKVAASGLITVGPTPPPVLQSIAVTETSNALVVGGATAQLTVTGTYDRGPTKDLTANATFSASTAGVVTISAAGVVTAAAAGTTTITATAEGKTATTDTITVTVAPPPALQSIAVTPANPTLVNGITTAQLVVTGTYNSGPTQDLTSGSTFAATTPGIVTISASGLVTPVAVGSTVVRATHTASGKTATTTVTVASSNNSGYVFWGGYAPNVSYASFGGTDALSVDSTTLNNGRASLKVIVPASNYTGGSLVHATPQNLSAFNAVQFYAKASVDTSAFVAPKNAGVDTAGIGNDAHGNQTYSAEIHAIPVTTAWQKFVIPLPDPSKATAMTGLFHFAEGGKNYTLWLSDIQYVNIGNSSIVATTAAVTMGWAAQNIAPGATSTIGFSTIPYSAPAIPGSVETNVGPGWFAFATSNALVATVNATGVVTAQSVGTATITGRLAGTAVPGSETVTVALPQLPGSSPATPGLPAGSVVALYSPTYGATNVWTYNAGFCGGPIPTPFTYTIAGGGDTVFDFPLNHGQNCAAWADASVGGSVGSHLDASGKTILHVDIWSPNPPPAIDIRLVDFSAGAVASDFFVVYGSGLAAGCTPSTWCSLDIPLNTGTTSPSYAALGQVLIVGADTASASSPLTNPTTLFIDNFYFH